MQPTLRKQDLAKTDSVASMDDNASKGGTVQRGLFRTFLNGRFISGITDNNVSAAGNDDTTAVNDIANIPV